MNKEPNTTLLCYEGKVEFKVKIKGKTYTLCTFNAGEPFLKYAFAKMLAGDLVPESVMSTSPLKYSNAYIPSYLEIWKVDSEGNEKVFTTKKVKVTPELVDLQNGLYTGTCFTGYIPFDYLQEEVNPIAEQSTIFYLYLFSGDDPTYRQGELNHKLAKIKISAEALSYITPGTTATVAWTMKLINTEDVK